MSRPDRTGPPAERRIAVIGMAVRLPGADTVDRFWDDVLAGRGHTRRFSPAELVAAGVPVADANDPEFVGASALLDDITGFDAELFGMSQREAAYTDPQHRLFLEVCRHALDDAGYAGGTERVGVFGGTGFHLHPLGGYLRRNLDGRVFDAEFPDNHVSGLQVVFGNHVDFVATRTAFRLGLTGPAVTVQTGCSTGLVGVNLSAQAMWAGDADLAVVATAAIHLPQVLGYRYVKGSIFSRTGVCRAFDAASDGIVTGNGAAAVVLKPLDRALADGDGIHAVILGIGVNNDGGGKRAYAAPSASGQTSAIRRALAVSGVDPAEVRYVETHGTGTFKGDPVEFAALAAGYRSSAGRTGYCALGSVKPSIGHLDSGAALPSLIKAIGVVRRGVIPPLANFTAANPSLPLAGSPFYLPSEPAEWPSGPPDAGPRRAGVTALGIGGTNVHLIVEEPPSEPASSQVSARRPAEVGVLPLSAASRVALTEVAAGMAAHLRDRPDTDPTDLVTTAALGRRHLRHRLAVVGSTLDDLLRGLDDFGNSTPSGRYVTGTISAADDPDADTVAAADNGVDGPDPRLTAERYCAGVPIDWTAVLGAHRGRRIRLPGYPFQRRRHWIGPPPVPPVPPVSPVPPMTSNDVGLAGLAAEGAAMSGLSGGNGVAAGVSVDAVLASVREATAAQVGCDIAEVAPDTAFTVLGADSLSMVNMARRLEEDYGVRVTMRELFEVGDTPRKLATIVAERTRVAAPADSGPAATAPPKPVEPPQAAEPAVPPDAGAPAVPVVPPAAASSSPAAAAGGADAAVAAAARAVESVAAGLQQMATAQTQLIAQVSQLVAQQTALLRQSSQHAQQCRCGNAGNE